MTKQSNPLDTDTLDTDSLNMIPTDHPAELDELDFDDDNPTDYAQDAQEDDPSVNNIGLTEASQPGQGPTNDDLSPETLILEDGARSQHEQGSANITPTDQTLSIVEGSEIGAGTGLDEAELAEVDPLDKGQSSRTNE